MNELNYTTMRDFKVSEHDGWFFLTYNSPSYSNSEDIGSGQFVTDIRFRSDEARAYYVLQLQSQDRLANVQTELNWLKEEIRNLLTPKGRIKGKKLREIIGRLNK